MYTFYTAIEVLIEGFICPAHFLALYKYLKNDAWTMSLFIQQKRILCWEGNKISSKYRGLGSIHDFVTMVHEKKCSTQQVHSWIRSHLCVCKYTPLSSLIKRVIWLSKLQSCKYTRPPKCRRNKILAGCLIGLTTCNFVCALYDNEVSLSRVSW